MKLKSQEALLLSLQTLYMMQQWMDADAVETSEFSLYLSGKVSDYLQ